MNPLHFPSKLRLSYQELFYLEQWIALLIGIVCLGVSARAGFAGFSESAAVRHSWLSESAWDAMRGTLTIAVALIGTVLVRFAFYKPSQKNPAAPVYPKSHLADEATERNRQASGTTAKPAATHKRRV